MTKRKAKIVFGVNDFLVGGMQRQLAEQMKRFDRTKYSFVLITIFDFPNKQTFFDKLPEDLEIHRFSFSGWSDIHNWWNLLNLLKRLNPDIVVSSLFFSNTVFRILKPFVGYVSIAREHNTYLDKTFFQRFIDSLLSHVSWCIVAVSRTVATFAATQERISVEKFCVIHNGVDVNAIRERLAVTPSAEEIKQSLGLEPGAPVFLNVARLMPQKNQKLLIEGFAQFHKTHETARLIIVGDGPLREELEHEALADGIDRMVIFTGHNDDVWRFYKIADALVSTSVMEGMSNVMLEALAAGVPLIATKTAGTDELLQEGENGFFIEEASPRNVRAALECFWNENRTSLREKALKTAEKFDIRKAVNAYENLFECVIKKGSCRDLNA